MPSGSGSSRWQRSGKPPSAQAMTPSTPPSRKPCAWKAHRQLCRNGVAALNARDHRSFEQELPCGHRIGGERAHLVVALAPHRFVFLLQVALVADRAFLDELDIRGAPLLHVQVE